MDDLKCSLQASERQVDSLKKERDMESIESGRRLASLESKVGNVDDSHSFCCSFPFSPGHRHLFSLVESRLKLCWTLLALLCFWDLSRRKPVVFCFPLGSFSIDDGDGNDNDNATNKQFNWSSEGNKLAAGVARTYEQIRAILCKTTKNG